MFHGLKAIRVPQCPADLNGLYIIQLRHAKNMRKMDDLGSVPPYLDYASAENFCCLLREAGQSVDVIFSLSTTFSMAWEGVCR